MAKKSNKASKTKEKQGTIRIKRRDNTGTAGGDEMTTDRDKETKLIQVEKGKKGLVDRVRHKQWKKEELDTQWSKIKI